MATKNSKAVKAIEESRQAPAFIVDEAPADEQIVRRTRRESATTTAARGLVAAAHRTMANGVSKTYRVGGEKADALVSALRREAAETLTMTIRTAPSATPGFLLWQLIDKAPAKRTRKSTKTA